VDFEVEIITQIAAPQKATNQASESQKSTSSRVMVGLCQMMLDWPLRAVGGSAVSATETSTSKSCYCVPMICVFAPVVEAGAYCLLATLNLR
jgi:hypothetical protein